MSKVESRRYGCKAARWKKVRAWRVWMEAASRDWCCTGVARKERCTGCNLLTCTADAVVDADQR
jgi:hypothetical protein